MASDFEVGAAKAGTKKKTRKYIAKCMIVEKIGNRIR